MRNRYVMSLLTLGAVAVFLLGMAPAAEAELIQVCKRYKPSGPKVCYYVESGSVDATVIAKGLPAQLAKYCEGLPGDEDCNVIVEFSIFGDIRPDDDYGPDYCSTFAGAGQLPGGTELFPNGDEPCLIAGQALCYNPTDHYNSYGTAFNLPGPLSTTSEIITCIKGGTCITESTLGEFDDNGGVCNRNWTLDFTPTWFYGQVAFCPGGYENLVEPISEGIPEDLGACCASDKRNGLLCDTPFQEGEPNAGQPGYLWTYCRLPEECDFDPEHPDYIDCYDDDGLIVPGVEFDCVECDLPSYCTDTKDSGYDPDECFDPITGLILEDTPLLCPES